MHNQEIKCNVESCKYNDESHKCTLNGITVGTTNVSGNSAHDKAETECASFSVS